MRPSGRAWFGGAWLRGVLYLAVLLAAAFGVIQAGRWAKTSLPQLPAVAEFRRQVSLPGYPSAERQYPSAQECARCHPDQVEAWRLTAHARAAENPLAHASICGRCHSPLGTQRDAEHLLKLSDQVPQPGMPQAAAEGISCISCHAPARIPEAQVLTFLPTWPNWRVTDLALETMPFDVALGTFGQGSLADPLPVANSSHPSQVDPRLSESSLCEPCHNVVVEKEPLTAHAGFGQAKVRLLTTYDEWREGPYGQSGKTCQSCHMPRQTSDGPAAVVPEGEEYDRPLPARPLADHTIIGTTTLFPASGPVVDQQEELVRARLAGAAVLTLSTPDRLLPGELATMVVTVTNTGAGHQLPTGFAYWSEAWLEVTVSDGRGKQLFASGDVDAEEWLRDEFNPRVRAGELPYDEYLMSFRARLVSVGPNRSRWRQPDGTLRIPEELLPRNRNGTPILSTADYAVDPILDALFDGSPPRHIGDALQEGYVLRFADVVLRYGVPPLGSRRAVYPLTVDEDAQGPIRVVARVLLRAYWPWMLMQQEELPTPRPKPTIYEVARAESVVALAGSVLPASQ